MHYRVGLPFWKVAALHGLPISLRVDIRRDEEAGVYVARSPDLDGLVVEARSLDDLRLEALGAAEVLLELALQVKSAPRGCRSHWFALPVKLRARIWTTYTPGQEVKMTPSAEYIEAAKAVQAWIAEKGTT